MATRVRVDPGLVEHYTLGLAKHGAYGETGVWRPVYSPAWVAAQDQVAAWCEEAGLRVWRDAVGSVWGRLESANRGKAIASGSHVDSQRPGGRYDGALGVVAALTAVRTLNEQFGTPKRPLEVVSFCEEEASRFPTTNFWGSRAVTGGIAPGEPDTIRAFEGETIAAAMREVGLDPARIPEAARDDIETFIELHIEQGPLLEQAGLPVGIVNAITGVRHYYLDVVGRTDHAGAVPMDLRRDPMAAAVEIAFRAMEKALATGRPAVTTVGRMLVEPNYPVMVPEKVMFTVWTGHPDPAGLASLFAHHEALFRELGARRNVDIAWRVGVDKPPCPCDPELVRLLEELSDALGLQAPTMHSGAAHDSQVMAKRCKVAMIFVQSKGGRSHTPEEFTSIEHAVAGIELLAAALHRLAY